MSEYESENYGSTWTPPGLGFCGQGTADSLQAQFGDAQFVFAVALGGIKRAIRCVQ